MIKKSSLAFLVILTLYSCKSTLTTPTTYNDEIINGWTLKEDILLRFVEGFDNNQNNWIEEKKDSLQQHQERFFKNGKYHITNTKEGNFIFETKEFDLNEDENFAIQVNFTFRWSTEGSGYVIFGEDKPSNSFYYLKLINKKNSPIYIGRMINGKKENEIQVLGDVKITGEQNRIGIIKYGNDLKFNVNDRFVHTQKYEPFFGKGIGIGCEDTANVSFNLLFVNQQKNLNPDFVPPKPYLNQTY